jgi:tetratricopeptide (TPR) repeat protein
VGEAEARRQSAVIAENDIERIRPELAKLTERALQLDPNLGSAYVLRAVLQKDPAAVEADLRRGIALAPNYGEGYYRLATRLLATRRTEALELLDRAIAVDPMRVRYRYIRAIEGYETDGDGAAMEARLLDIMRIDPGSTMALEQLARAVSAYQGRFADGIRYAERALALNPESRTARVYAAELYFAVGDIDAGRDAAQDPREISPVAIASAVARGDMRAAGRMALTPVPQPGGGPPAPVNAFGSVLSLAIVAAVLDESLHTKDYERGLRVLRERHCFPRDKERRCLELSTSMAAISIGQLLLASGRRAEGEEQLAKVLELLAPMKDTFGLPPAARARAYAALGRNEDALRVLTTTPAKFAMAWWVTLERDPTFDSVRADPRFQAVLAEVRRHAADQKARLDAMRRSGEVPMRPAAPSPPRGASG